MNTMLHENARFAPSVLLAGIVLVCFQHSFLWVMMVIFIGSITTLELFRPAIPNVRVHVCQLAFWLVLVVGLVPMAYYGANDERGSAVLMVIAGVVAADIGALAVGRLVGGPRLPGILSNKSWSGIAGGMICGAIAIWIGWSNFESIGEAGLSVGVYRVLLLAVPASAMIGDLSSSYLKRKLGIKDWGKILLGHGGVTDRFFSWALAFLVFAFMQ